MCRLSDGKVFITGQVARRKAGSRPVVACELLRPRNTELISGYQDTDTTV